MNEFEAKKSQSERLLAAMALLNETERKVFEDMIIGAATVNKIVAMRAAEMKEKQPA
jgi:hypothetical protein